MNASLPLREVAPVLERLARMRAERIWPNGLRYLWTDAFGVVLLVSLWRELREDRLLRECEWVVAEVDRVLGRRRGIRIGEAADRDGQYFHYLAMWIFALGRLGTIDPRYRTRAIDLAREIHRPFVVPGVGVLWKMREDLSGPYPGFGLGALDAFHGKVVYQDLAPEELAPEIEDFERIVESSYRPLVITQDLGLGMMLWMSHFQPEAAWARTQRERARAVLDSMWIDPPGYFCREPDLRQVKFAFTNYGVSLGLQAVGAHEERVRGMHRFFDTYRSGDRYDQDAITHVMACTSRFPGAFLSNASRRLVRPQDAARTIRPTPPTG